MSDQVTGRDECAVCGARDQRLKLEKDGVSIRECAECGLAYWRPDDGFDPRSIYDAAYFGGPEAGHGYDDYAGLEESLRRSFARRLERLEQPRAGARLLDVGAAFGFAVAEAERRGYRAVGVEISRDAARRAGGRAQGRISVADAASLPFADGAFDAITLWDVVEHLGDPHAAIREIARLLRPGGQLVLTTGDVESWAARLSGARWHLYTLPEHLFFHSRRSLERLLATHGLRVEACYTDSSFYTLGYLVERLRKTIFGRAAARAPRWPGAGLSVPVNLFDIVTVRAIRSRG